MAYEGVSIVDYLKSVGQATDYASRSTLAASKGITGYVGSAEQNTQLLNMLRGGATTSQPTATTAPSTTQTASAQTSSIDLSNPVKQDDYAKSLGYTGWNDYQDHLRRRTADSAAATSGVSSAFNAPTINLPELYEGLYAKSGIKDIEGELSAKSRGYTEQVAKIKDNPYLSEGTMTGRLSKLQDKFNADSTNIRSDIATRKADIETQLNLQTKQFDINSQQAQLAISQFTSLLQAGALNSASGEDIANITRATGLSSNMIQSMITYQQKKDAPKLELKTVDDGTNQYVVAINSDGVVVNKQVIAASEPTATKAATAEEKLTSGNFTNAQVSKAIKILAEADVLENPDDRGDKLLSASEQRQALLKIQAEVVADPTLAGQLLEKAAAQGGFSDWTG